MNNNLLKVTVLFCLLIAIVGCSTAKDYKVRAYIQRKDRVDQQFNGNSGYIMGEPKPDTAERKKTRPIFVLEVSQKQMGLPNEYYKTDSTESYKVSTGSVDKSVQSSKSIK